MNTFFLQDQLTPKTIYENNPELVSSETLILAETKRNYLLNLTSTQALTIDESQLSSKANQYGMTFNLTIVCNNHAAINFQGCNIQQMEFYRGESKLKFTKNWGSGKWDIEVVNYGGIAPTLSLYGYNLRGEFTENTETGASYGTPLFSWMTSYEQSHTGSQCKSYSGSEVDYYTFSINPYILTGVSMHFGTSNTNAPTQIQIYGSNDFKTWTEIYSQNNLTPQTSTTVYFVPTIIRPFKHYKFHMTNSSSQVDIPPLSMKGIGSELLYAGYIPTFPAITAAMNGYDVALDTSEGCELANSTTAYGLVTGNSISVTRPSTSVAFKITYTYPTAVRPCGFYFYKTSSSGYSGNNPDWFAWYGSDDGETWERVIELRSIFNLNDARNGFSTRYPCDFGKSYKYWQFRCYELVSSGGTNLRLQGLSPIVPSYQYAEFETIVPIMSSDSQDGYTVSASSTTDGAAYKMYDGDSTTYCGGAIADGAWTTTIDMGSAVIIQGIQMRTTSDWNRMPTAFKIQGSNNGTSWTDISTQTPGSNFWENNTNVIGSFEFENDTAYQYYQLVVTATAQGSYVRICDLGWTTKIRGNPIDYYTQEYLVPIMASDSQDGYIASANQEAAGQRTYYAWRAFDRSISDSSSWAATQQPAWLQIELPTAKKANILKVSGAFSGEEPTSFTLYGSNDGSDFTQLMTASDLTWTHNETKTWNLDGTTAYKYYKLGDVVNTRNSWVDIAEFTLINREEYKN